MMIGFHINLLHNINSPSQSPTPVNIDQTPTTLINQVLLVTHIVSTILERRLFMQMTYISVLVTLSYSEALARPAETRERQVMVRGQALPTPSVDGG